MSVKVAAGGRLGERARAWRWLLPMSGVGMGLLYLLFTAGYPLTQYYDVFIPVSQQTKPLFSLSDRSLILFDMWVYVAAVLAIHVLYLGTFAALLRRAWLGRSDHEQSHAWLILVVSAVCAAILLWSYPLFSQDVFDYMFQTREWVVYSANPFTNIPDNFRFDPLYKYASWTQAPNAYGPLWLLLTAPLSLLAGDNLLINVLLYKALAVAAYGGTVWLVYSTLGRIAPRYRLAGTVLFAWNPIMLIEFAGSGHNDVLMLYFMALAVWLLVKALYIPSLLALTAGGLIKIVPVLILPFFVIYIWQQLRRGATRPEARRFTGWWARLHSRPLLYLAIALALCAIFAALAYIPFWDGLAVLNFLNRGEMIAGAVVFHHVQGLLLLLGAEFGVALLIIKAAAWGGFALFYTCGVWSLLARSSHNLFNLPPLARTGKWLRRKVGDWRLSRLGVQWWVREDNPRREPESDLARLIRVCLGTLVFFTLFSSLYYQPWYLTWPLLFLPFMLAPRYKWHVLALTIVSTVTTLGFVFV